MSPLKAEDLQRGTVCASAKDLSSGMSQELTIKTGSRCHFFEPFEICGFRVQLRLDWKDVDAKGNPTLDADFYNLVTGQMDKSMKAHCAHHTQAQADGPRRYEWTFADRSLSLQVSVIWSDSVSCSARAQFNCSAEVIRPGE